jgi:DNA-binding MarR family transcriptional regulator
MDKALELNSKIFRKDNLDLVYLITEKKILNGILHYKLKSSNSEETILSEFAIKDRFVSEIKETDKLSKKTVSRLFLKLIKKGYITGNSNDK